MRFKTKNIAVVFCHNSASAGACFLSMHTEALRVLSRQTLQWQGVQSVDCQSYHLVLFFELKFQSTSKCNLKINPTFKIFSTISSSKQKSSDRN